MVKVSCLCPTYNRPPDRLHLIEEALESFLRQDYPAKELIILNDTPGQTLHFDHPQVRIVNTPFRCGSLGDKRNLMAALATGELLCPWDDDDLCLPPRLSRSVELLGDADYYNPQCYWMLAQDGLRHTHAMGWGYIASIYRKSVYQELGGTPGISMGEDAAMHAKLRSRNVAQRPPLSLNDWYYIYRWGVSPVHLSGVAGDSFYSTIGSLPIEPGQFTLRPHWRQDYAALARSHAVTVKKPMSSLN